VNGDDLDGDGESSESDPPLSAEEDARIEAALREIVHMPERALSEVPTSSAFADPGGARDGPQVGEVLGERFEVTGALGRGGFGHVYAARDLDLGRAVALKLVGLRRRHARDADREWFDNEARATARLNHPNIVTLFDWGVWRGCPYLVLERLHGEPLSKRILRGALPEHDAIRIARAVAGGLAHAHAAGVLHLDLKPQNIFLTSDGGTKILDLGLAQIDAAAHPGRALASASASQPRTPGGGTPGYMAPEQRDAGVVDARADLFALGVVLFEMIEGHRPELDPGEAGASTPGAPTAAAPTRALLTSLLAPRAEERPKDAQAVCAALDQGRNASAPISGTVEPYRYLAPFNEDSSGWLFGRDAEITRLHGLLSPFGLVALAGASGAGKTSLVRGGLLPRIRGEGGSVVLVRPTRSPLDSLSTKVAPYFMTGLPDDARVTALRNRPGQLGQALRAVAANARAPLLLVVDPLEELVTLDSDRGDRTAFLDALLGAADEASNVRVLLVFRAELLPALCEHPRLRDAITQSLLILGAPDAPALEAALRGPAERLGVTFEEGVVESIVASLASEAAPLPLLQIAASRLWERRDPAAKRITREALDRLGGVAGVLAAHAEEVFASLASDAERDAAKHVFLALGTAQGTRRALSRDEVTRTHTGDPPLCARIIDRLVAGRLLTAGAEGEGTIEVAHEQLFERWDRLRGWREDARAVLALRERIEVAATAWEEAGRPTGLVWRGTTAAALNEAREDIESLLGPAARAFTRAVLARERRVRTARRASLWILGALGLFGAIFAFWSLNVRERSRETQRIAAIVRAAREARDPAQGALLLAEVPPHAAPPEALRAAHALAARPLPRAILRAHDRPVAVIVYDPTGERIASGSHDGSARIWRHDGRGTPLSLVGHKKRIRALRFTAHGSMLATASEDGTVRLWRVSDGRELAVLDAVRGAILAMDASADGTRIATGRGRGVTHLFKLETQNGAARIVEVRALQGHTKSIRSITFDAQGARVLTASDDMTARVWSTAAGELIATLRGHTAALTGARFSRDGARVMTASRDGTARVFEIPRTPSPETKIDAARILSGHRGIARAGGMSPDGTRYLTYSDDGTARVFGPVGSEPVVLRGHRGGVLHARWLDASRVITTSRDSTARIWRADGAGTPLPLEGHGGVVYRSARHPSAREIATCADDGTIRVWATSEPIEPRVLRGHERVIGNHSAHLSADGRTAVTASQDHTVRVWDLESRADPVVLSLPDVVVQADIAHDATLIAASSGRAGHLFRVERRGGRLASAGVPIVLGGHTAPVISTRLSPDLHLALTASRDATARLWRTADGTLLHTLTGHTDRLLRATFLPDGARVVTASADKTARVYGIDGALQRVLSGHDEGIVEIAPSPDGRFLATASSDRTVRVWPLGREEKPRVLRGHTDEVWALAWSPDSRRLATGSHDFTVRLWNLHSQELEPPRILRGHTNCLWTVTFDASGTRLLTAGEDGTARLFRVAPDVEELLVMQGHQSGIYSAALSRDGTRALTTSQDRTAQIWRLSFADLIASMRGATTACLPARDRIQHLGEHEATASAAHARCKARFER
jgi:WD40 repeat protein